MHSLILSDQRNVLPASSREKAELSLSATNSLSTQLSNCDTVMLITVLAFSLWLGRNDADKLKYKWQLPESSTVTVLAFSTAQTLPVQDSRCALGCSTKNHKNKRIIKEFLLQYSLTWERVSSVISWSWASHLHAASELYPEWISEHQPWKMHFHSVLQAPPVPATRFNRSYDPLGGPGRKGLKRLFRAAFL